MIDPSFVWQPWFLSALIAALVAMLIFWLGLRATQRTYRKERQRASLEEWLRQLTAWVDQHAHPDTQLRISSRSLTNRHVTEMNLARQDRYLAWWMHEMAVAILARREEARQSFVKRQGTAKHIDALLNQTGESLLAWHHGELKSSDFHLPYALRNWARKDGVEPHALADKLQLSQFLVPKRMTWKRRIQLIRVLADRRISEDFHENVSGHFVGRYTIAAVLSVLELKIFRHSLTILRSNIKIIRLERRIALLNRKVRRAELREQRRNSPAG